MISVPERTESHSSIGLATAARPAFPMRNGGARLRTFPRLSIVRVVSVLLLSTAACQKSIVVEPQQYDPKLTIEGLLQPGEVPKIFLNRTTPFFVSIESQTASNLFVPDARVTVSGDGLADELQVDSTYNGFFCRWEPFYVGTIPIRSNVSYSLAVTHAGRTYTASTVTNVEKVAIDSVSYTSNFVDIFGGHEGVIVDFRDTPNQVNQYRFISRRPLTNEHETVDDSEYSSTCLADGEEAVTEEIGRFVFFDRNFDGAEVRFVAEPSFTIFKGDEALIYVQSVDAEVARFYDTLDRQREANINPFAEPVTLYSQIDGAIGVFGAVNRSDSVLFIFPEDAI